MGPCKPIEPHRVRRQTAPVAGLFGYSNRGTNRQAESSRQTGKRESHLSRRRWPPWWEWELEFSSYLLKRMEDRRFTELNLRRMLERATGYRRDLVPRRWVIDTRHRRQAWEVIVEPLAAERLLLVITAYPLEPKGR